jgi:hypothetical protein
LFRGGDLVANSLADDLALELRKGQQNVQGQAPQPMLVAELFFGRNIKERGPLTDAEWAEFVAETITPNFPEGFTVFDGQGQWRNPLTGNIAGARTKIVLIAAKREPDLTRRLSSVIDIYKTQFRQQSVGTITRESCAAF